MADKRPFVANKAMTAIAIGYRNPMTALIADDVLPRVPVGTEDFKWLRYNDDEAFTIPETRVGRKGRLNEVEFSSTEEASSVETYGLKSVIPNSDLRAAEAQRAAGLTTYDPRNRAAALLTDLVLLDRERRVASVVQSSANYDAGSVTALANAADRFDVDTGHPEDVIDTLLDGSFIVRPNVCAMSGETWNKMRKNANLVKAVTRNLQADGKITAEEFIKHFGLAKLLIGESWVNTARPGQPATLGRCWGKHIAFLHMNPTADTRGGVTWGYTATFGERVSGTVIDPDIGLDGGEEARVGELVKELVVCKKAGALITNAIS